MLCAEGLRASSAVSTNFRTVVSSVSNLRYTRRCRRAVLPLARRSDQPRNEQSKGFRFEKEEGNFRVSMNDSQLVVPEQAVLLTGLALLGLGAVIGPLVIGLTVAAVSIGFSVSIGALALSTMFLPMALFMLFFTLTFGGFFGSFALLGLGVFMPKLLSLIITGAGLAIGWTVVRMLVPKSLKQTDSTKAVQDAKDTRQPAPPPVSFEEEQAKRVSAELRDFDQVLADREYRRRVDQWKKGGSK